MEPRMAVLSLLLLAALLCACVRPQGPLTATPANVAGGEGLSGALCRQRRACHLRDRSIGLSARGGTKPGRNPLKTLLVRVAVEAVEVRLLESFPVQIELVIKGALPDGCEYQLIASEQREGQMVSIMLEGQRPADLSCTAEIQPIAYTLLLGDGLPLAERGLAPGDYTPTVNDYQTSFSVE